jgi:hypothetical protein
MQAISFYEDEIRNLYPVIPSKVTKLKFVLCEFCSILTTTNRVLESILGTRRDEVTGGWRKLHNEELRNLYCLSSMIRIMKSRKIRWAGHVA